MDNFNFNGYKLIVQCTENDLVEYLGRNIPKIYGKENCVVTKDYIFAKGKVPVLLCAHMDTVFNEPPKDILYNPNKNTIFSPQGIGGDDRSGIYSIIYIIKKLKNFLPCILFTTKEEVGCLGAKKAARELKDLARGINFAIQIDRKGKDDAVFYNCGNWKFIDFICSFGYKETKGIFSDISVICPEWNIAGVNFSCGYYNNHTKEEVVRVDQMFDTINMILKILSSDKIYDKFPFMPRYGRTMTVNGYR